MMTRCLQPDYYYNYLLSRCYFDPIHLADKPMLGRRQVKTNLPQRHYAVCPLIPSRLVSSDCTFFVISCCCCFIFYFTLSKSLSFYFLFSVSCLTLQLCSHTYLSCCNIIPNIWTAFSQQTGIRTIKTCAVIMCKDKCGATICCHSKLPQEYTCIYT